MEKDAVERLAVQLQYSTPKDICINHSYMLFEVFEELNNKIKDLQEEVEELRSKVIFKNEE